jgi:hypothetical protein
LLIYESIEILIDRHNQKPQDKRHLPDLHRDIEEVSRNIGRKVIDVLIREVAVKFQTQLDTMKFICTEFWKYIFSK